MGTIYAVSSGRPPAAVAVIRISGPGAFAAAEGLCGVLPPPRRMSLRALRDGAGALLDRALVVVFEAPHTATGDDLVELHCHGGRAIIAAVERHLATLTGLRAAQPGEFTRRALANARIDLAQAEGLADLLAAETEAQRIAAQEASEGRISQLIRGWLAQLSDAAAQVEALLDFADEDDVVSNADLASVQAAVYRVAGNIEEHLAAPPVERLKDGIRVVIGGPANSGKSTLLNLMTARDAAIVSPIAGTTRDRIEVPVTRGGVAYLLTDTAGLNTSDDLVERLGIARAHAAMDAADVLVWTGDDPPLRGDAIWVHARADLCRAGVPCPGMVTALRHDDDATIEALWRIVAEQAARLLPSTDRPLLHKQQRAACAAALTHLLPSSDDALILAEQLRAASRALATILGYDATEKMLDALFGRFCIGK